MELHLELSRSERKKRVEYLLDRVGLQPGDERLADISHVHRGTPRSPVTFDLDRAGRVCTCDEVVEHNVTSQTRARPVDGGWPKCRDLESW